MTAQKITTFLTFPAGKAEEAAKHYTSIFDGRIASTMKGGDGATLGVTFELFGQQFIALNGPEASADFAFTNGISLFVTCETQREIDAYWEKLIAGGGKPVQCGWLKDKFGVAWQIVPTMLSKLLQDPDRARAGRAFQAMLKMAKLDIAELERAAAG